MIIFKFEKVFDYLKNNLSSVIAITLQLAFVFALIYYSIDISLNFYEVKNKIVNKINNDDLYYISNNEDYTIKLYENNNIEQYKKFYEYLESNYRVLSYKYNNVFIPTNDISIELRKNSLVSIDEFSLFAGYWVNNDFLQYFKINISEGRRFEERDFTLNSLEEDTPVILGSYFNRYFKLGDKINFKDYDYGGITRSLKVIGFLEEDQYIINKPVMITNVTDLNYSILLPNTPINTKALDLNDIKVINSINLNSYKNITESFLILDKKEEIDDIKKKSEEMDFFDIKIDSSRQDMENVKKIYISQQNINSIILIFVSIAIIIEIFISIVCYISKRKEELSIYYIFGANKKYILDLFIIQQSLYFIFGIFSSVIFINLFKKVGLISSLNIKVFLITSLIFLLIMNVANIVLYICMNKLKYNFYYQGRIENEYIIKKYF